MAVLALMPKCLLCAAAYLGVGAALGLTGPEICGARPATFPMWLWVIFGLSLVIGPVCIFRIARARTGVESPRNQADWSDSSRL